MHAFVAHGSMIEEKGWGIPVEESVHAWLSYTAWSLMDDSNMQAYIKRYKQFTQIHYRSFLETISLARLMYSKLVLPSGKRTLRREVPLLRCTHDEQHVAKRQKKQSSFADSTSQIASLREPPKPKGIGLDHGNDLIIVHAYSLSHIDLQDANFIHFSMVYALYISMVQA